MDQTTVSVVNNLTLAAAAIIACGVLWRAYTKAVQEHIADLRDQNQKAIADLRTRIMLIEDALNISRADRTKYMPTLEMPSKSEMKGLD